ncbi:MAG: hypothetical protein HYZ29_17775 [Myxococcales bacterium]|nr:hypothetical protein [Myxococcales bacterium]
MTKRRSVALVGVLLAVQGCGLTTHDPDGAGGAAGSGGAGHFDCVGAHWKRFAPQGKPMNGLEAAAWRNDTVVVWAGVDTSSGTDKEAGPGWRVALDGTISSLPVAGAPSRRAVGAFDILGDQLLVWSGYSAEQDKYLEDGARLDLLSDQWFPLPSAQTWMSSRHTAAHGVVGSRWLVWGGLSDGAFRKDGAVWDPEQDAWSPVVDAPIAAEFPALAQGDAQFGPVVVGTNGKTPQAYAYGFDPGSWAWWELPEAEGPGVRASGTASFCAATQEVIVWGGVVWGGDKGGDASNTGERFSRAEGWRSMSTLGAPTPRIGHSAAVAGTKLVILGTTVPEDTGALATGGVYDLLTDSWGPLPAGDCAPPPRPYPQLTAFGDGKSLLVWGRTPVGSPHQWWILTL